MAQTADFFLNPISLSPPYSQEVSTEAERLHQTLFVGDLHADSLLWERNLLERQNRGHVDIPRLIEGNVAIQAFTVFTKIPLPYCRLFSTPRFQRYFSDYAPDASMLLAMAQLGNDRKRGSLMDRALYYANHLQELANQSLGLFTLIKSKRDLEIYLAQRAFTPKITAGFLGLEGAHVLGKDSSQIQELFKHGYRMVGLVHFFDNAFAGSSSGYEKGGLTDAGEQLVRALGAEKMILDLAHASPKTIEEVLNLYDKPQPNWPRPPLLVSHTGVKGTCNRKGLNLTDRHIQQIGEHGGLIGIGLYSSAVCGENVENSIDAIERVIKLAGIDHVALGSDFDGGVQTHFDVTGISLVTNALLVRGTFSETAIRKIMGDNLRHFLERHLPN